MCLPHKKSQATFLEGSQAIYLRPVAFRPCLPAGLAFSVSLNKLYVQRGSNVKLDGWKKCVGNPNKQEADGGLRCFLNIA
jgi:hypothetical protein